MKPLIQSTVLLFFISAGLASAAPPAPTNRDLQVNAYGEPVGFASQSEVILPNSKELNMSNSRPGSGGSYIIPGTYDVRNNESSGSWQARVAAVPPGNVIIGPLEVLGSGPTGPMTPEARATARDEVTTQVLERIRATDKIMSDLESRSASLDKNAQVSFNTAATAVAEGNRATVSRLVAFRL